MSVRIVELADAKEPLSEYARQAESGPIILTRQGDIVAIVIAVENADSETVALSTNSDFMALIERSRLRQQKQGGLTSEEMRRLVAAG